VTQKLRRSLRKDEMQGNVEAEPSLAFQIAHCHTFRKNDSNVPPVPAHGSTMTNTILVYTWTSCRLPVRHRLTRQTKRLTILAHLCRNTITSDEHVPPFQEGNKLRLEFHEGTTSDGQPRGAHSRHSSPTPSLSTERKTMPWWPLSAPFVHVFGISW
jgi:hypothetical protein